MEPPSRKISKSLEVRPSRISGAGMGLWATKYIRRGSKLGRYIGERIDYETARGRDPSYFMHISESPAATGGYVIDGRQMDNPMRWANHSRLEKNAQPEVDSHGRITFVATEPIRKGREVFIDYGDEWEEEFKHK